MRRVLMLVAAAAIPASGAFVALSGGQAWAKGFNGKVTCTTITGTATSEITISGCSDSGTAATGPSTVPFEATELESGGVITWIDGNESSFGAPALKSTSAKHCPVTGSTADKISGAVNTADDSSDLKVPGKYKGAVCIAPGTEAITALKPLAVS
jgi:hypothetical protein